MSTKVKTIFFTDDLTALLNVPGGLRKEDNWSTGISNQWSSLIIVNGLVGPICVSEGPTLFAVTYFPLL